jgi:large subunit ribosomal protein L25
MATLEVQKRDEALKPKQLRQKGIIPAVLFGKNLEASISIQLTQKAAEKFLKSTSIGVQTELNVEGEEYLAMLKNVSYEVVSHKLAHMDFQVLTAGELVKTTAHIKFINKEKLPPDGILNEMLSEIKLECLPKDMPDDIVVDLAGLNIGDSIAASELDIMKDNRYRVLTSADSLLVHVSTPTVEVEVVEEDNVAMIEVPVIGSEE